MDFDHGGMCSGYVEALYHARSAAIFQTRKPVHSRSLEWLKNPAKIVKFEDNHRRPTMNHGFAPPFPIRLQALAHPMRRYPALSRHACVRPDHG
jgi:hypothetical protein